MGAITDTLLSARANRQSGSDALYALTYDRLRKIANKSLKGSGVMRPTELVHEAWIRLSSLKQIPWESSKHFFRAAAEAMRFALVDQVRRMNRVKRGAGLSRLTLNDGLAANEPARERIIELNDALEAFEKSHPEKAEVIKLKFFARMTNTEIADVTGLSKATVERYAAYSRAWLHQRMSEE